MSFVTYYYNDGSKCDIESFDTYNEARDAIQRYYDEDIENGEFRDRVYGIYEQDGESVDDLSGVLGSYHFPDENTGEDDECENE